MTARSATTRVASVAVDVGWFVSVLVGVIDAVGVWVTVGTGVSVLVGVEVTVAEGSTYSVGNGAIVCLSGRASTKTTPHTTTTEIAKINRKTTRRTTHSDHCMSIQPHRSRGDWFNREILPMLEMQFFS